MKKLFADPHFNVMDGLDIYIDDYSKPDPIPTPMLRQLASAKFLDLFDEEEKEEAEAAQAARQARDVADNPTAQTVAQSETVPTSSTRGAPTMPTLICDCNKTMPLQEKTLGAALGEELTLHSSLCRREAGAFQQAIKGGDEVVVACTQEKRLFGELGEQTEGAVSPVNFVNIRETGGWSRDARKPCPSWPRCWPPRSCPTPSRCPPSPTRAPAACWSSARWSRPSAPLAS